MFVNTFKIFFISVNMSGSSIILNSYYERNASPVIKMGVSSSLNPPPVVYNLLGRDMTWHI